MSKRENLRKRNLCRDFKRVENSDAAIKLNVTLCKLEKSKWYRQLTIALQRFSRRIWASIHSSRHNTLIGQSTKVDVNYSPRAQSVHRKWLSATGTHCSVTMTTSTHISSLTSRSTIEKAHEAKILEIKMIVLPHHCSQLSSHIIDFPNIFFESLFHFKKELLLTYRFCCKYD